MEIKYNIDKSQRKALAQKISELTGAEVRYLGVPSCAYQIDFFTIDKDCVLHFSDRSDSEIVEQVLEGLDKFGYIAESPNFLTVELPRQELSDSVLENLKQIIQNKYTLFCHAFDTDILEMEITADKVRFPWFTLENESDATAYNQFISCLATFAKNQKRINNKPDTSDNEKYAFRCFLLRLGMIGAEYKQARKVLLRNLTGSAAFRHGKPEGETENAVSE